MNSNFITSDQIRQLLVILKEQSELACLNCLLQELLKYTMATSAVLKCQGIVLLYIVGQTLE